MANVYSGGGELSKASLERELRSWEELLELNMLSGLELSLNLSLRERKLC